MIDTCVLSVNYSLAVLPTSDGKNARLFLCLQNSHDNSDSHDKILNTVS